MAIHCFSKETRNFIIFICFLLQRNKLEKKRLVRFQFDALFHCHMFLTNLHINSYLVWLLSIYILPVWRHRDSLIFTDETSNKKGKNTSLQRHEAFSSCQTPAPNNTVGKKSKPSWSLHRATKEEWFKHMHYIHKLLRIKTGTKRRNLLKVKNVITQK